MRVAIVKPDHLGDFVLSKPAIGALLRRFPDARLFVGSAVAPLAHAIFPQAETATLDMPHLAKGAYWISLEEIARRLSEFDLVVFLREDAIIADLAGRLKCRMVLPRGDHLRHETLIQQQALKALVDYRRTELFSGTPIGWPGQPRVVGLCIAAGFPTNRWPHIYWIELGRGLMAAGWQLKIIGGPAESDDADLIRRYLGLGRTSVVIGTRDFLGFWDAIDETDLVIATDGGTAHLCSLRRPVLSLFASSPWRRYAPFGKFNRVLTRDLACSPCMQFSHTDLNACMTRECAAWLLPSHVTTALHVSRSQPEISKARGIVLSIGTSHLKNEDGVFVTT